MVEAKDKEVATLCRSAFEAEHQARYSDAAQRHNAAVIALSQLADDASFFDRERKRIARKQAKFHQSRIETLNPILRGQQKSLQVVLPTAFSAQESLMVVNNGQSAISWVCIATRSVLLTMLYGPS